MIIRTDSLSDLSRVAVSIIDFAAKEKIWVLVGGMGAGKTTLTKAIGKELRVEDTVNSPTFSIVNEYLTNEGDTIYHFDFYRLETPDEALSIGADDYFYSGNLCLIEWPQKIGDHLPEQFLKIEIEDLGGEIRNYKLSKHG